MSIAFPTGREESYRFHSWKVPHEGAQKLNGEISSPSNSFCLDGTSVLQKAPGFGAGRDFFQAFASDFFTSHANSKKAHSFSLIAQNGSTHHSICQAKQESQSFLQTIEVPENSKSVYLQEMLGVEGAQYLSELTQIKVKKGAHLHWYYLQDLPATCQAMVRHEIFLEEGASFSLSVLSKGSSEVQIKQSIFLQKKSALQYEGLSVGKNANCKDHWIEIFHEGGESKSNLQHTFVLEGTSKGIFNSLVKIPPTALLCEAHQKCKSLLLQKATTHAIPRLIIQTDQVKCSHGASVTTVSPDQTFYMESRGLTRDQAKAMVIGGFMRPLVESVPVDSVKHRLAQQLEVELE